MFVIYVKVKENYEILLNPDNTVVYMNNLVQAVQTIQNVVRTFNIKKACIVDDETGAILLDIQ